MNFGVNINPKVNPLEHVEEGRSVVFGDQRLDLMKSESPARTFLPTDNLSYHVAYELTHLLLKARKFPAARCGAQYPKHS